MTHVTLTNNTIANNVVITQNEAAATLSISFTQEGEINTISNVGTGAEIYKEKVGTDSRLRTLIGGDGVSITENANDLTIDVVATTDDITEGSNLYYTDERVDDRVSTLLQAGTNISITYDDDLGTLTIDAAAGGGYDLSGNTIGDIGDVTITTPIADNEVLAWNSATSKWINQTASEAGLATSSHTHTTSDISEGTNLYYTDARVGSYLSSNGYQTASSIISTIVDSAPGTLDTLNELAASLGDDANFASTVTTALGTKLNTSDFTSTANTWFGTKTTTNLAEGTNLYYTTARFDSAFSGKTTSDLTEGSNLYYTNTRARTSVSVIQNSGSGNGTLSYNNTNGVFTYTPPDLSGYLTSFTETNDLTAAVTWANVPDANITQSSVTQHQAALSITESQISDLGAYLTAETNDLTTAVTWANVPDANITQSSVTQHQAALSITESQISDLTHYTNSDVDAHLNQSNPTDGYVLSWTSGDYAWVAQSGGGGGISLTDLSVTQNSASGDGTLTYDNTSGVFTYTPPDLTAIAASTALNVVYTAVNKDTSTLAKGTPVYAKTGTTSGQTVEVAAADASDPAKMPAIGVLGESLAVDAEGELLIFGEIQGVDTSPPGFSVGDIIYVAVGGGYTNSAPTGEGNIIQNLGIVSKVHPINGAGLIEGSGRGATTPNLNDGNIFIGNASNQSTTATLDTDLVPEAGNLYYTDARVDAEIDNYVTGGTGVTVSSGQISIGQDVATNADVEFNTITSYGTTNNANSFATIAKFNRDGTAAFAAQIGGNTGAVLSSGDEANILGWEINGTDATAYPGFMYAKYTTDATGNELKFALYDDGVNTFDVVVPLIVNKNGAVVTGSITSSNGITNNASNYNSAIFAKTTANTSLEVRKVFNGTDLTDDQESGGIEFAIEDQNQSIAYTSALRGFYNSAGNGLSVVIYSDGVTTYDETYALVLRESRVNFFNNQGNIEWDGSDFIFNTANNMAITADGNLNINAGTGSQVSLQVDSNNSISIVDNGAHINKLRAYVEQSNGNVATTGTLTIDPNVGTYEVIQLTGNITINGFDNAAAGQSFTLVIQQPSSGGPYTLTSTMLFAGGNKTLSTSADAIDVLTIFYDGVSYYASLSTNFS